MKTTEGPMTITEGPMKTTERPMKTTEGPMKTTEGPMKKCSLDNAIVGQGVGPHAGQRALHTCMSRYPAPPPCPSNGK